MYSWGQITLFFGKWMVMVFNSWLTGGACLVNGCERVGLWQGGVIAISVFLIVLSLAFSGQKW